MSEAYATPLMIGQEVELEFPDRPLLRGTIALWRQVDDYVFAVSIDTGRGRIIPVLLVRDPIDGVLRAELPIDKADDLAVRQLLGLPIRMPVNQQANVLAARVLSRGGRP